MFVLYLIREMKHYIGVNKEHVHNNWGADIRL